MLSYIVPFASTPILVVVAQLVVGHSLVRTTSLIDRYPQVMSAIAAGRKVRSLSSFLRVASHNPMKATGFRIAPLTMIGNSIIDLESNERLVFRGVS